MPLVRHPAPKYSVDVEEKRLPATTEEEQRYEELYRRLLSRLISFARSCGLSRDDAEDVVHDALIDIWWRWSKLASLIEGDPVPFFFGAVYRQFLKWNERGQSASQLAPVVGSAGVGEWSKCVASSATVILDYNALAALMAETLAEMPQQRRAAWTLVREAQLSYENAAAGMGIQPVSIRQHITLAHQDFRAKLIAAGYRLSARIFPKRPRKGFLLLPGTTESAAND